MKPPEPDRTQPSAPADARGHRTGFALISGGGIGAKADNRYGELSAALPFDAPVVRMHMDTDLNQASSAERRVSVSMDAENVSELFANARRFGRPAAIAVEHLKRINATELLDGSRTTPAFTQLALAYHTRLVLMSLRWCLRRLRDQGATRYVPIVVGSNGGGFGSAMTRVLPMLLATRKFRNRLMVGVPESRLLAPVVMTAYPIGYARNASVDRQETKILANIYAWLREVDWLLGKGAIGRVMAIGYSNPAGVAIDTPTQMASVLGRSLYQFVRNYGYLMSRAVDTDPALTESYLGVDLPERVFPSVQNLVDRYYSNKETN